MNSILEHLIDIIIKTSLLLVVIACVSYPLIQYVKQANNYYQTEINELLK